MSTKLTVKHGQTIVNNLSNDPSETEVWDAAVVRAVEAKGVIGMMPILGLRVNPDNPRDTDWQSDCDDLYGEMCRIGFDKSQPLSVILDEPDCTTGMVVRGNRRLTVVLMLLEKQPELFATIFPDGMIPVVMFKGLDKLETAILTIDHGKGRKRKELTLWENFLAIRVIRKAGTMSVKDICATFGKTRSWVQKLLALTALPVEVRNAFEPVLRGKTAESNLRVNDILYVSRDYTNNSEDGFKTIWNDWVTGNHPDAQINQSKGKDDAGSDGHAVQINYTDLVKNRNVFDSAGFVKILGSTKAADFAVAVDNAMKALEADCAFLAKLQECSTSKQWNDLVARVNRKGSAGPAASAGGDDSAE